MIFEQTSNMKISLDKIKQHDWKVSLERRKIQRARPEKPSHSAYKDYLKNLKKTKRQAADVRLCFVLFTHEFNKYLSRSRDQQVPRHPSSRGHVTSPTALLDSYVTQPRDMADGNTSPLDWIYYIRSQRKKKTERQKK